MSLPSRERGLKSYAGEESDFKVVVAPFTGAWIEIPPKTKENTHARCRSLHGSVD